MIMCIFKYIFNSYTNCLKAPVAWLRHPASGPGSQSPQLLAPGCMSPQEHDHPRAAGQMDSLLLYSDELLSHKLILFMI